MQAKDTVNGMLRFAGPGVAATLLLVLSRGECLAADLFSCPVEELEEEPTGGAGIPTAAIRNDPVEREPAPTSGRFGEGGISTHRAPDKGEEKSPGQGGEESEVKHTGSVDVVVDVSGSVLGEGRAAINEDLRKLVAALERSGDAVDVRLWALTPSEGAAAPRRTTRKALAAISPGESPLAAGLAAMPVEAAKVGILVTDGWESPPKAGQEVQVANIRVFAERYPGGFYVLAPRQDTEPYLAFTLVSGATPAAPPDPLRAPLDVVSYGGGTVRFDDGRGSLLLLQPQSCRLPVSKEGLNCRPEEGSPVDLGPLGGLWQTWKGPLVVPWQPRSLPVGLPPTPKDLSETKTSSNAALATAASAGSIHGGPQEVVDFRPIEAAEFKEVGAVGDERQWKCTGVLVAPRAVVTARHCLPATQVRFANDVRQALETYPVARVEIHPFADVALLELAQDPGLNPAIRRTAQEAELPMGLLRAVGYGATDTTGTFGFGKRHVADISGAGWGCDPSRARLLGCNVDLDLVLPGGQRDTCKGDSGGPLYEVFVSEEKSDEGTRLCGWRMIGVTSRPVATSQRVCGDGGIYTRVDRIGAWLETILLQWSA